MFLGVDGGGTKTAFCLLRSDGVVVASAVRSSAYATSGQCDGLIEVLREGSEEVCTQAGITPEDIDFAFFGLPTYGEVITAVPMLDQAPREVLHHDRYACDNDMVCGWAGSLGTQDGINVISGTGSMAYGEHAGRRARTGGWGEIFGDEGSAHWIATRGLAAFSQMSDGRITRGPLYDALRKKLGVNEDFDVMDVVHHKWGGRRRDIAGLSTVVVDAANQGDTRSRQILVEAAAELVVVVHACRQQLHWGRHEVVPVSYSGGVFSADLVREAFIHELAQRVGYDARTPLYPPVVGAALYAAKRACTPLVYEAIQRLQSTSSGPTHRPTRDKWS